MSSDTRTPAREGSPAAGHPADVADPVFAGQAAPVPAEPTLDSDVAIRVSGLSKCFQLYDSPGHLLKQLLMGRLARLVGRTPPQYFREFWALKGLDFTVRRGETVGIVGRNGAGKSTLLQILCGTLTPTAGQVDIRGRVAALLELGAGFNPEFSGRENVYLNGAILGISREEISRRFADIEAFADIGEFIDRPVKSYSSGMYVRLAFAVSACVEPDVLIVDEALAVGDAKFQAKCFRRFEELVSRGTTILLVTHSTEQITRHCDRAILLEGGVVHQEGPPKDVANTYLDLLFGVQRKVEDTKKAGKGDDAKDGKTAAGDALQWQAKHDRSAVMSKFLGKWTPQLSSKQVGLVADGQTWTNRSILAEFLKTRQANPNAVIVNTSEWSVFDVGGWWVTLSGELYATADEANAWCDAQGYDSDHCLAKRIESNGTSQGTTKTR